MAKKSYAENITSSKVMIDGLRTHNENLPAGLTQEFINQMEEIHSRVQTLNSEQEKLKADLKTKTEALETQLKELQNKYAEAKKRIKLDFPQTQWREFGIEDKR